MWSGLTGLFLKIEQGTLYNEINFSNHTTDPSNSTVDPADHRRLRLPVEPQGRAPSPGGGSPTGTPAEDRARPTTGATWPAGMVLPGSNQNCTTQDPTNPSCCIYDNGVMYQNSAVSFADITDGIVEHRPDRREPHRHLARRHELLRPDQHRPDHQQADHIGGGTTTPTG